MRHILLALALFLIAPNAFAAIYQLKLQNGDSVVIDTEKKCTVLHPWMDEKHWKAGTIYWKGKQYALCWRVQEGAISTFDSSGEVGTWPIQLFKPLQQS